MALFRKFLASRQGNVAITFSLALIPIIAMVGLGVDVAFNLNAKTVLDGAADAAALAAVTTAQGQLAKGATQADANTAAVAAGKAMFASNTVKIAEKLSTPKVSVSVQFDAAGMIKSEVGYQTEVGTVFGKMFGINSLKLSRSADAGDLATASLGSARFMEITFALDNSNSMGIGATKADIDRLGSLTVSYGMPRCELGCHVPEDGERYSTAYVAAANGVKLRIDAAKDAMKQTIAAASKDQSGFNPKRISFSIYTLADENPNAPSAMINAVTTAPSTSYDALSRLTDGIQLASPGPHAETSMGVGLQLLASKIGASGNGASAQTPQKFVIVITDGVEDLSRPYPDFACRVRTQYNCTAPFDPVRCKELKDNGVTVVVVYTTYIEVPLAEVLVRPFINEIPANLKACASSPDWFAEASDTNALNAALTNFYKMAQTATAVLTQ